ncbi:thiamine pyrophosphate-dependent dehydrogenase E1 component subunit alpha, partial [Stella sp.]|uniref:thiamine pyrophosphate-dependent dehydrogenase E1 component subunit alpha n=1 Tax=Stella sp. TaxID=2912054 RepID=UPI0035B4C71F
CLSEIEEGMPEPLVDRPGAVRADATGAARGNLDRARILGHYRTMARIRAFEEAADRALQAGHVKGAVHLSIGQEAVASGVCANLERGDFITSNHRGHGHTLAKGADMGAMMAELFGRASGSCQGKGGSMHIADFQVGMLGANGVVGAGIPIAVGAAHAMKLAGDRRIVVCFFGDGAVNRGPFLEGLNWAKVFDLPVLFVCEDNGFAATTRTRSVTAGPGPGARAESLGIPSTPVDGNDVVAVDAAAAALVAQVRAGAGPQFLHARTYRLRGHTAVDAAPYRPAAEVEERWHDEPLRRCRDLLALDGVAAAELDRVRAEAEAEVARAVADGLAAPHPGPALAWTDVQDVDMRPVAGAEAPR